MDGKITFKNEILAIINDDVLTTKLVHNGSVDLIITSPPYNVDIQYNSHNDKLTYT